MTTDSLAGERLPERAMLAKLMIEAYSGMRQGRLVSTIPGGESAIHLFEGMPIMVDLPGSGDHLGRVLLEFGLIEHQAYNESLMQLSQGKRKHGEILLEMKALTRSELAVGLNRQAERKLHQLFKVGPKNHRYERSEPPVAVLDGQGLDPYPFVFHALRNTLVPRDALDVVGGLLEQRLVLVRSPAELVAKLSVADDERHVVFDLSRPFVPADLVDPDDSATDGTMSLLAALRICGMLKVAPEGVDLEIGRRPRTMPQGVPALDRSKVTEAPAAKVAAEKARPAAPRREPASEEPPVKAPAGDSGKPRKMSEVLHSLGVTKHTATAGDGSGKGQQKLRPGEAAARVAAESSKKMTLPEQIMAKFESLPTATLFEVLGVSEDADGEDVHQAYLKLVKIFHPDRVPASEMALRQAAEAVFAKLSEAHNVLRSVKERTDYVARLREHGAGGAQEPRREEAALQFSKGDIFLRKREFETAVRFLEWAASLDQTKARYQATLAWARYQLLQGRGTLTPQKVGELRTALLEVGKDDPGCAWVPLYLARIAKQRGENDEALKWYRKLVAIDEQNVEAKRELRLAQMRADKAKPGSLWDKLRGK